MIKNLFFFFTAWAAIATGYSLFRNLTGKEKLTTLALLAKSALAAVVALILLTLIVITF